ncbi:hypothetical protein ACHAWF_015409 [Thalassiosira exigua]
MPATMVTTFSARLLGLADRCKPIVGSRRVQSHNQHQQPQRQASGGLESQGTLKTSNPPYESATKQHRHPRQSKHGGDRHNGKGARHARHRPHNATSAKRKRQREEGAYAAAVVEKSLADAGRPPMSTSSPRGRALPRGSSDESGARVMSSREWDRSEAIGAKRRRPDETAENDGISDEQKEAGAHRQGAMPSYDVSTMYALAGLIQSTRRYYNFSDGEDHADGNGMLSRSDHCSDDKLSENSEGQSSWTPSSTFGGEMTLGDWNEKKGLDDDNRSDGQSSAGEDGSATGEGAFADGASRRKEGKFLTEPVAVVG